MESPVHALSGGGGILELQVRIYFDNKLISPFGSVINKRVKSLCLAAIHISHTKWLSGFHLALLPRPVLVLVLGVLNVIGEVEEDNVGEPAKHQLLHLVRNLEQSFSILILHLGQHTQTSETTVHSTEVALTLPDLDMVGKCRGWEKYVGSSN